MAANIPTNTTPAPTPGNAQAAGAVPVWTEAPASATLKVVTPSGGFEVLLTSRASRMSDLLAQLTTLEAWLIEHGWQPAPSRTTGPQQAQGNTTEGEAAPVVLCDTCGRPMKQKPRRDGNGMFWSCETRYGSEWCKGKPKK